MKNIIKASVLVAGMLFATSAFATQTITSAGTPLPNGTFKPSNNVTIKATTDAEGTKYSAGAKHLSGDREYASTNTEAKIYYKAATVGTADPTFGVDATTAIDNTWTSQ